MSEVDPRATRHEAVLRVPDGAPLSAVLAALDTLDDDRAVEWLEEHPDTRERVETAFREWFEMLGELYAELPDEYHERVEMDVETGIYDRAYLTGEAEFRLQQVYYWSTNMKGEHLVDVHEEYLPTGVDPVGCRFRLESDGGLELLSGQVEKANETFGDQLTLVVGPTDQD